MNLIVQIPCLNEGDNVAKALASIPEQIEGIDQIKTLVIDDGSSDATSEVAAKAGADYILRLKRNRGLAQAFRLGLDSALSKGADIIVNFDADNQYPGDKIAALVEPILRNEAEIVIGNRNPEKDLRNSKIKRICYKLGRSIISLVCRNHYPDPVSGFRAISREAALEINIMSSFSYTLEMIVQAEHKKLKVMHIPIVANEKVRPSRLFKGMHHFVFYSARTLLEVFILYKPLTFFFSLASLLVLLGVLPLIRFLWIFFSYGEAGHTQSLVFGSLLILTGVALFIAGIQSHLVARNRFLLEQILKISKSNSGTA